MLHNLLKGAVLLAWKIRCVVLSIVLYLFNLRLSPDRHIFLSQKLVFQFFLSRKLRAPSFWEGKVCLPHHPAVVTTSRGSCGCCFDRWFFTLKLAMCVGMYWSRVDQEQSSLKRDCAHYPVCFVHLFLPSSPNCFCPPKGCIFGGFVAGWSRHGFWICWAGDDQGRK